MNKRSGVLLVIGCVLLLVIAFLMLREPAPEVVVVEAPVEVAAPVQREVEPEPEVSVPVKAEQELDLIGPAMSIAVSHPMIIDIVQSLSPSLVQWLVSEELLRKWVILIDQIAEGQISNKFLPVQYEMPPFAVVGTPQLATGDPKNYDRANKLVKAFVAIEPEVLVAYYRLWQPLLDEAYAELGKKGTFDERVVQAIRQLQSVPAMPEAGELAAKPVMYKFIDPTMEKAPSLHKWMWRLGPKNQAEIKGYLTRVKLAMYKQS
ncbi:DUF3014 domain-containing protein [Simiduia curdlanivorans]|uniref:DUF3014 domain-containing protein n=1 Tax=Simiduia curdlanivorans TaxID=1492769 RepID=A0ABV8V7P2_9GAMM|nr:DUF3014 domain-containing protein [Simiduia curdlanivorans]MDN3639756.1 DUF3014 domain-containing protein [Simiduia curdlanivorans]